ncbi:hypothetical protein Syun_014417 [Stephania yunnanensis]|uniref:Uncharacterized protein n=1 Tax=Stephania yunnanensis TaxID=152371 RepID=A0AAP0JJH7_9MAGN
MFAGQTLEWYPSSTNGGEMSAKRGKVRESCHPWELRGELKHLGIHFKFLEGSDRLGQACGLKETVLSSFIDSQKAKNYISEVGCGYVESKK